MTFFMALKIKKWILFMALVKAKFTKTKCRYSLVQNV